MDTIQIYCQNCYKAHDVDRTEEIPDDVVALKCNWCPSCMDDAPAPYEEWYVNENEKIRTLTNSADELFHLVVEE